MSMMIFNDSPKITTSKGQITAMKKRRERSAAATAAAAPLQL
jgi:hypothetical protein